MTVANETTNRPGWLVIAEKYLGLREIPGAPTAPVIAAWLQQLGAWWSDDETPWCGVAMAAWMREAGFQPPTAWYRAKAWATWGISLSGPVVGCVVVFTRKGGGHVGLVVGQDPGGKLMVLGGNQGDAVSVAAFDPVRAIAYRWPDGALFPDVATMDLPIGFAPTSKKEE
jgi:uncharacterized protein (TIGR02594 family)